MLPGTPRGRRTFLRMQACHTKSVSTKSDMPPLATPASCVACIAAPASHPFKRNRPPRHIGRSSGSNGSSGSDGVEGSARGCGSGKAGDKAARGSAGRPSGGNRHGSAQQRRTASLAAWNANARTLCKRVQLPPPLLMRIAKDLRLVPNDTMSASCMSVAAKVSADLLRKACLIPGMRLPTLLGEFAASLEAHPRLCRAAANDKEFMSAAISTFDAAAIDDNTYSNAMCVSQLAVAQRRLNLPCERFWRELERREHVALGARGLANVYHAYAALAQQRNAAGAAASDALCSKLEERAVALAGDFAPQGAANCLWAVATLERKLPGPVRAALLAATQRTALGMNPQDVANIMWAFAKLECKPDSECLAALLCAVQRTARGMNPQNVANTLWLSPGSTPRRWRAHCGARCCRRPSARRRA